MGAGLPSVVTDIAGNRDLFSPQIGFMVPARDSEQMASSLKHRVENPALQKKMGAVAQMKAERYDWHKVARRYLGVYKKTTSPPASAGSPKQASLMLSKLKFFGGLVRELIEFISVG